MQRVYTDDGNGDGRLAMHVTNDQNLFELLNSVTTSVVDGNVQHSSTPLSHAGLAILAMPATNMMVASRKEMTDTYDRFADRALQQLETPLWETEDVPSVDEEALQLAEGQINKLRFLFVNLLLPAFDALRTRYVTSQGERDGVLIGMALALYHREHGQWPATLAELSPRWLPALPVDRITGEPLRLKIVDDRPIVYSAGIDTDDDGGRLPESCKEDGAEIQVGPPDAANKYDGDWVIWSTVKE
jgi:hypothetical protein